MSGGLLFIEILFLLCLVFALWRWPRHGADEARDAALANEPASVVRIYHGNQQPDAVFEFREEAQVFAAQGYIPSSQSWAPGQWGCGMWLVALLLCFGFGIGVLVFLYMLIVKPAGTLTVTYVRQKPNAAPSAPGLTTSNQLLVERLNQLDAALAAGLISAEEHKAKRTAVLEAF